MPLTEIKSNRELFRRLRLLFTAGRYEELVRLYLCTADFIPSSILRDKCQELVCQAADLLEEQKIDAVLSQTDAKIRERIDRGETITIEDLKRLIHEKQYSKVRYGAEAMLRTDPGNWRAQQLLRHARHAEEISAKKERAVGVELRKLKQTDTATIQRKRKADKVEEGTAWNWLDTLKEWTNHLRQRIEAAKKPSPSPSGKNLWRQILTVASACEVALQQYFSESSYDHLRHKALKLIAVHEEDNLLALKLHKGMVPDINEYTLPGFEVWGETIETEVMGGDAFNFLQRDADNILFYIADASGHGVRASLLASQTNYYIRQLIESYSNLHDLALKLNQRLRGLDHYSESFVTILLFNWNLKTKVLSFVGCGHEHFIIVRKQTREVERHPAGGVALGMIANIGPHIEERQIRLEDGDELALYSDGVVDVAMKKAGNDPFAPARFGRTNFEKLLAEGSRDESVQHQVGTLLEQIGARSYQRDDVTLLVLRRNTKSDVEVEPDVSRIDSIDLESLKRLTQNRFANTGKNLQNKDRIDHILLELDSLMARGEFALVIVRATKMINEEKLFHPKINHLITRARILLEKEQTQRRKMLVRSAITIARQEVNGGEYLKAKMILMRVANLDEKNRKLLSFLRKVDALIQKYGNRNPKKTRKASLISEQIIMRVNTIMQPLTKKDILGFFVKLANMTNAGIRLKDALVVLLRQTKRQGLRSMLATMMINLEKGFLLSYSMEKYRPKFSGLQINLVKAGEESGNLGMILDEISKEMQQSSEIRRKIKGAMIYPAFIVGFCILLIIGLLIGVVPKLAQAYAEAGIPLPLPTRMMIGASAFLVSYGQHIALGLCVIGVALRMYHKTLSGQLLFDKLKLKIFIIGQLARQQNIYLFGNSLSMLLESGILLLSSLSITADVAENIYYKRDVVRIRNEITNGRSFSMALGLHTPHPATQGENPYFPLEVAQMIQVGETTGQIIKMLRTVATSYQKKLMQFMRDFSTLIEPVLIVFVGLMVGGLILSIMLPFFEFGRVVQSQ